MGKLKELKIVLIILLIALTLVILRSTDKTRFKQDVQYAVEAVTSNNFSVSLTDFRAAENQYFIVDINESGSVQFENSIKIAFEKLLAETTLQKLKETEKKILLVSEDYSLSIKAWVILTQLGFKNVFVLSNDENAEILKYELQPDTSFLLESISE